MKVFVLLLAAPATHAGMISQAVSPPPAIAMPVSLPPSHVINAVSDGPPRATAAVPRADLPARPVYAVDVIVTADGRELYRGVLRLAPGSQTSYEEGLNQPLAAACPGIPEYDAQERSSLRIIMSIWPDRVERTHISVSWNRAAAEKNGCRTGATRTVQLTQAVDLAEGGTVVIEGDGGLKVSLKRR